MRSNLPDLTPMKTWSVWLCFFAVGCSSLSTSSVPIAPNNRWSDTRLDPVLDAQDHRDSKVLLVLLKDTAAAVREAAALAFVSVQDTSARDGSLTALRDEHAGVRIAAARALSFVADTGVVMALSAQALKETDPTTMESLYASSFLALTRVRPDQDPSELIDVLRKSTGYQRAVVADVLRRLPQEKLLPVERAYVERLQQEREPYVKLLLLVGMKKFNDTLAREAVAGLLNDPDPKIRVAALRAHGAIAGNAAAPELLQAVSDSFPAVRSTAVEMLQTLTALDGSACWTAGQENADVMVKIPLYGLAVKYGDEGTRDVATALLKSLWGQDADPYVRATLIDARTMTVGTDTLIAWMNSPWPAVERQAAFAGALKQVRKTMTIARYASRKDEYAQLASLLRTAFETGDAGLIAAAADELLTEDDDVIAMVLDNTTEMQTRTALHPIRDLEALQVLDQATAKRDGLPMPIHQGPAFNHPIDLERLATLKEGKQYRITTTKGDIVIAIEPDAAPGTCVAFDSLVTSGFYNGKYFHRVVPNFVAQGGCPRGDGYGAMDWTLRTEIGPSGFVAGAVGIASAGRDTESCQFFITLAPAPHLDGRYTRFAHVVSGLEVAQLLVVGDRMTSVQPVE